MARAALVVVVSALLVVGTSLGAGQTQRRTLVAPAAVRELAASGPRAALLVGPRNPCRALVVWNVATGRTERFRSGCSGSARDGTFGAAITGTRLAWVVTGGGNLTENTVETATTARPKAKTVSFVGSGPDVDGDYVGEVVAAGGRIFFSEFRRCAEGSEGEPPTVPCPPGGHSGEVVRTQIWMFAPGAGGSHCPGESSFDSCRLLVTASERLKLLAAAGSRLVMRASDGSLELLSTTGTLVKRIGVTPPDQASLSTRWLAVHEGRGLQLYSASTGDSHGTPIAVAGKLVDSTTTLALLTSRRTLELVRLSDGRIARIHASGSGALSAQLESPGLYYATGRRLTFLPMKTLLRRFG